MGNSTVISHKEGWGTVWSTCVSVTGPFVAKIFIDKKIKAVTDEVVRNDLERLARFLKSEYQLKYKEEINKARFKVNVGWKWLGISASGKHSDRTVDKYENGKRGLEAARETFSKLLSSHVNTESVIKVEASVKGGRSPAILCIFFKIENVRFADDKTVKILANIKEAETATSDYKPVKHEGPITGTAESL